MHAISVNGSLIAAALFHVLQWALNLDLTAQTYQTVLNQDLMDEFGLIFVLKW